MDNSQKAIGAYMKYMNTAKKDREVFPELPGFVRYIECGALTPWFYAIGNEELLGDYALPEDLSDDPVFRLGTKFVVTDRQNNCQRVKTCMEVRYFEHASDQDRNRMERYRIVYWSDGSAWRDDTSGTPPRPLLAEEMWITEALAEFEELLSGKSTDFEIRFTDSTEFVGRIKESKPGLQYTTAGQYLARVILEGDKKPREGTVDFEPSVEYPDVISYITNEIFNKNVVSITVLDGPKNVKGWPGVFYEVSEREY